MNDPNHHRKSYAHRLSAGLVAEFQEKYLETFGDRISAEVAESELCELAELIKITCPQQQALVGDTGGGEDDAI